MRKKGNDGRFDDDYDDRRDYDDERDDDDDERRYYNDRRDYDDSRDYDDRRNYDDRQDYDRGYGKDDRREYDDYDRRDYDEDEDYENRYLPRRWNDEAKDEPYPDTSEKPYEEYEAKASGGYDPEYDSRDYSEPSRFDRHGAPVDLRERAITSSQSCSGCSVNVRVRLWPSQ